MTDFPVAAQHTAPDEPELAVVPAAVFVSILGSGAPATSEWHRKKLLATRIARELAYRDLAPGGVVPEHMYYWYDGDAPATNIADFYSVNPLADLNYRALAPIHSAATLQDIEDARLAAGGTATRDDVVEIFTIPEQLVVQVLHTGPFSTELETLARMGAHADAHHMRRSGPHQEIHLDPFTLETPQDSLRTIIRDPVA